MKRSGTFAAGFLVFLTMKRASRASRAAPTTPPTTPPTMAPVLWPPPPPLDDDGEVVTEAAGGGACCTAGVTVDTWTFVTSASIVYPARNTSVIYISSTVNFHSVKETSIKRAIFKRGN